MYRFFATVALACSLLMVGCSSPPPLGKVTGKVTFRGEAVSEGAIIFSDDSQGVAYVSDLTAAGDFVFEVAQGYGLPPGAYEVAITPPRSNKPGLGYIAPNYNAKTDFPNLPEKYREAKTSGLSAVVKAGANEPYVFDMK